MVLHFNRREIEGRNEGGRREAANESEKIWKLIKIFD